MTGRVYMAANGQHLGAAQAELQKHLRITSGGVCASCGERPPCSERTALNNTILGYGSLPRRRPGFTLSGLRRTA